MKTFDYWWAHHYPGEHASASACLAAWNFCELEWKHKLNGKELVIQLQKDKMAVMKKEMEEIKADLKAFISRNQNGFVYSPDANEIRQKWKLDEVKA